MFHKRLHQQHGKTSQLALETRYSTFASRRQTCCVWLQDIVCGTCIKKLQTHDTNHSCSTILGLQAVVLLQTDKGIVEQRRKKHAKICAYSLLSCHTEPITNSLLFVVCLERYWNTTTTPATIPCASQPHVAQLTDPSNTPETTEGTVVLCLDTEPLYSSAA